MEDKTQYSTIGEKFEAITKGKRPNNTMVWLTNDNMNKLPAHQGNPVLMEIPAKQFAKPNNPFLKQGYSRYVHSKPAPEPKEAKAAASSTQTVKG